MKIFISLLVLMSLLSRIPAAVSGSPEMTVIYEDKASTVRETLPDTKDLWLTLPALTQVSGFVLKPQGACLNELCVPIPKLREKAFLRKVSGRSWFNLSELARVLHQPVVHDSDHAIWLFGMCPETRMKYLSTLAAPNFTLPDWKGTPRALTDFHGKKVLLITWASW